MTATYTESVETMVGGGPQVAPPALAPPLPADALRFPSRLANQIDEAIEEKQRGQPQGPTLTGGTYITVADGIINCTLVGGTHITISDEDINHDSPGEQHVQIAESGTWIVANAWLDALGHVRLD